MTAFVYVCLYVIMLFLLFISGRNISKRKNNVIKASLLGIIAFSLNEGLRFGRGLDYNYYAREYEYVVNTHKSTWDICFAEIAKFLGSMDIPWQGYVFLMSLVLIVSGVLFVNNFKDVSKWALPLFAVFTMPAENLMRWFFGWSIILIGLSFILDKRDRKSVFIFIALSVIACLIHFGLFPIIIVYFALFFINKPLLKPYWSIAIFLAIALIFNTSFMERFIDIMNLISINERTDYYVRNTEYWLTGGYAGNTKSAFPKYYEFLLFLVNIWFGYKLTKYLNSKFIYLYNLFLLGFITYPICRQIELLFRYNNLFTLFQFVILAYIVQEIVRKRIFIFQNKYMLILSFLIILNYFRVLLFTPFYDTPDHFLYIWDSNGRDYLDPYIYWIKDMK